MAEAKRLFGEVTDLPFPAVPPDADERALDALVDEYFKKILDIKPAAVHVMGEMTFTCRMVQKLKEAGITCLASTTE
ncbi:MAG: CRISPR-associated protein, partial [Methanobacteriota archaeon]